MCWLLFFALCPAAAVVAGGGVSELLVGASNLERDQQIGSIAYLMMLKNGLPLEKVWDRYFATCDPGSFNIYVHEQEGEAVLSNYSETVTMLTGDQVESGDLRHTYSMNNAMWNLLRTATEKPENTWFHYISESCMPIRSCPEFHSYLNSHTGTSFVGNMPVSKVDATTHGCWNHNLGVGHSSCHKSSQWVTLHKDHAFQLLNEIIPQEEDFWKDTTTPDEFMIPSVFAQHRMKTSGYTLTYVKWPKNQWPEPAPWQDMRPQADGNDDCTRVQQSHPCDLTLIDPHISAPSQHTFFARKITANLVEDSVQVAALISRISRGSNQQKALAPAAAATAIADAAPGKLAGLVGPPDGPPVEEEPASVEGAPMAAPQIAPAATDNAPSAPTPARLDPNSPAAAK